MYPISAACKKALTGDHTRNVVCEVYKGFGGMVASTYSKTKNLPLIELDPSGGQIQCEYKAKHCRSFQATILDESGVFTPSGSMSWFDPITRPQLQFYFDIGWQTDLGMFTERIPAGRFMLDINLITELGGMGTTLDLSGNSRSSTAIQDHAWLTPYQMQDGISWDASIIAALRDRTFPGWIQQFRFAPSSATMPLGVVLIPDTGSDPWEQLQAMDVSDAKELFEDATGAFVSRVPPDVTTLPSSSSVWSYNENENSSSHETGTQRKIDISKAKNGAIVNGNAPWLLSPVQGVAWDANPSSPTYYKGPFGMRAETFSDETVGTEQQADLVAQQKLSTVLGVSEEIDFDTLPNPAQDPGDVVTINFTASKVSAMVIMQSFKLPFSVLEKMPVVVNRVRR